MNGPLHKQKRGYLPHYDSEALTQFITFRLADSLPASIYKTLQFKLRTKQISEIEYHHAIERALDVGGGKKFLNDPRIARLMAEALIKFDDERYRLLAWVVMPNHVHLLLKTINDYSLASIIHSIKSYTSTQSNKILLRQGQFWTADYFDRFIRDRVHFDRVKRYIENNPLKAGLCELPEEWPWGSKGYKG
jgi:REP element-mobilizing transposase RayT